MSQNSNDKILRRKELEDLFKDGAVPEEVHFKFLINSMINKQDDGFSKNDANGFEIRITNNESQKFISLFKNSSDSDAFFSIEKKINDKGTAFVLNPCPENDEKNNTENNDSGKLDLGNENPEKNAFFFNTNGNMGIGKMAEENLKLEVDGFVGMKGRIGTHVTGQVLADGVWKDILPGLDNCNGYEVMARVGIKGKGKFALLHAIALATFGHSKGRIRKTSAHYGFFWNKLNLRWKTENTHNYSLQIKSNVNYGNNVMISYRITQLWDDELFEKDFYIPK